MTKNNVIVVTSGKGGVGKTTTSANVGTGLAKLGKKVCLIDTDIGLRNLDVVMGLENRIVYNLVDVIEGNCRMKQALIKDKRFENLYLLPKEMITLDKIKCIRPGIFLGEVRKGRFVPSHHLAAALKKEDFKRSIALDEDRLEAYLKGETIAHTGEKGYGVMLYKEKFPVGWYKLSDGQAKNHYPKHLRKA